MNILFSIYFTLESSGDFISAATAKNAPPPIAILAKLASFGFMISEIGDSITTIAAIVKLAAIVFPILMVNSLNLNSTRCFFSNVASSVAWSINPSEKPIENHFTPYFGAMNIVQSAISVIAVMFMIIGVIVLCSA